MTCDDNVITDPFQKSELTTHHLSERSRELENQCDGAPTSTRTQIPQPVALANVTPRTQITCVLEWYVLESEKNCFWILAFPQMTCANAGKHLPAVGLTLHVCMQCARDESPQRQNGTAPSTVSAEGHAAAAAAPATTTVMVTTTKNPFQIHYHVFGCSVLPRGIIKSCVWWVPYIQIS